MAWSIAPVRRCYFSTVILVTFLGSSGTFFKIPGLYRQANTRPAIRPPSEWPVPREGKIKEAGRPGPPPSFILVLSLDTNHLVQSVDDLHQIALRRHDRFDGLVGRGRFVDDLGILTAFDARRHALVVFHGEPPLRFRAGHRAAGPVAAAHETFHVPFATHVLPCCRE